MIHIIIIRITIIVMKSIIVIDNDLNDFMMTLTVPMSSDNDNDDADEQVRSQVDSGNSRVLGDYKGRFIEPEEVSTNFDQKSPSSNKTAKVKSNDKSISDKKARHLSCQNLTAHHNQCCLQKYCPS